MPKKLYAKKAVTTKKQRAKKKRPARALPKQRPKSKIEVGSLASQEARPVIDATLPTWSSVETGRRVSEAITKLSQHRYLARAQSIPLGEFWERSWPRAPFEEELTLKQIAGMNHDLLLRKRSFQGQKVVAFVFAIEKFLTTWKPR